MDLSNDDYKEDIGWGFDIERFSTLHIVSEVMYCHYGFQYLLMYLVKTDHDTLACVSKTYERGGVKIYPNDPSSKCRLFKPLTIKQLLR